MDQNAVNGMSGLYEQVIYMDKINLSWWFVSSSPLAMLQKQNKFCTQIIYFPRYKQLAKTAWDKPAIRGIII